MKKIILLICFTIIMTLPVNKVNAMVDNNSETGLSKIEDKENKTSNDNTHLNDFKIDFNPIQPQRYFTTQMEVNPVKQDRNYYCGYAAVKAIIHYLNGSSKTQYEYASELGHPNSAVSLSEMVTLLNRYTSKNYTTKIGNQFTLSSFVSTIENSVTKNMPVVVFATTDTLAMYNGKKLYHYIVATGYTMSMVDEYNRRIIYIDSWSADYGSGDTFGKHVDTKENVFGTFKTDTVASLAF